MTSLCDMEASFILEKEFSGHSIWIWAYPSIKEHVRTFLQEKISSTIETNQNVDSLFCQWKQKWFYILKSSKNEDDNIHKMVKDIYIIIQSKDFNPEKYEALISIFMKSYKQTGSPENILKKYLSVYTSGRCPNDDNGHYVTKNYSRDAVHSHGNINGLINLFGREFIILYTAVVLKKRIIMYHSSLTSLLNLIRVLPSLAKHRENWSILYPHVDLNGHDVDDLKAVTHYIAGFTQIDVEGRYEMYDVFVNVPNAEIIIAEHAKDNFTMGKLHRDLANYIVQCGESASDTTLEDIAVKTNDLLNNLRSLASEDEHGNKYISMDEFRSRKMAAATENFLYQLALCEGLVRL